METEAKILQAIFDHAALGIAQISLDGSWLRVNKRYCEMLGYSESELLTRKIWDITRPPDYDEVSRGRRQLLEGVISSHTMEKRFVRKDGTIFWGRLNRSLVRNQDNQPQYFIAVVEDITDRRQAEATLRESEERFRVAFYQAAVGIAQTRPDGRWLFVNDRYCEMFGYSQAELRGKNFLDITHPDDNEASHTALRQLLAGEISSLLKEKRYVRKDGGTLWARLFTSLVRDQHNQPQCFISVLEDITEQKLMQERLRAS
jgi:PAS domain S-box-containing protein